jgi:hypothetical protein
MMGVECIGLLQVSCYLFYNRPGDYGTFQVHTYCVISQWQLTYKTTLSPDKVKIARNFTRLPA